MSFSGGDGHNQGKSRGTGQCGFTLIELLTVISIIAVVAGLIVGLAPGAARMMRIRRVEGELNQLVTAIEQYHALKGYYPPDNALSANPPLVDPAVNPLYYELKGWTYTSVNNASAGILAQNGPLYTTTLRQAFHRPGIANSSLANDPNATDKVKDFLPNLSPSRVARVVVAGAPVDLLTVPVPGPGGLRTNTWHYVSSSPTNNPGKFDLWAEVQLGKDTKIIGNWKE